MNSGGFLFDETGALMLTTSTAGAAWSGGFLRAPGGELVVVVV